MTKNDLCQKKRWLDKLRQGLDLSQPKASRLYHYTSLPVLFSILENDSIWASGTRFSNDSSEEMLLTAFPELNQMADSFIVCFSDKEDCLSQWRGYCFEGGAAIEFDILNATTYSILHADYETSGHYELDLNAPLPVLYVRPKHLEQSSNPLSRQLSEDEVSLDYKPWKIKDIIPYFKDRAFWEENEWRLLFGDHKELLSECVRFRTLGDGAKVPYIVVKAGKLGDVGSGCDFLPEQYSDAALDKLYSNGITTLRIPLGNDQEKIYYKVEKAINEYNKKFGRKMSIYCEGHLPIRRIMVAPTYDRERVAEKIKRYCWSNYWLRQVEVTSSQIPYIPPSE